MLRYNNRENMLKISNTKMTITILFLFLSLSCCVDSIDTNNNYNDNNYINDTNNINNSNNISNNISTYDNNINNNISNIDEINNNTNMSVDYEIIKFGTRGNDKPSHNIIIDNKYNKTTIYIHAGKKPSSDYRIKITKIIKDNNNNLIIYVNGTQINNLDMIITSPYIVVRVSGVYNNVKILYD